MQLYKILIITWTYRISFLYTQWLWEWWMRWLPATVMRLLRDLQFLLEARILISGRSLAILCRGCGTGGTSCLLRLAAVRIPLLPAADVANFWSSDCNHWAATSCADSCSCSGCVGGTSPRTIMRVSPPASSKTFSTLFADNINLFLNS